MPRTAGRRTTFQIVPNSIRISLFVLIAIMASGAFNGAALPQTMPRGEVKKHHDPPALKESAVRSVSSCCATGAT
jgi:hypothetical protein